MKIVRFYASDWLTNEINRRVRRARHQGRVTTTASDVIRELLHHAIAAEGAGRRSKRALKARARRQARALEGLHVLSLGIPVGQNPVKARSNDGQEKEGVGVLAGADGGSALPGRGGDRELSPPSEDS